MGEAAGQAARQAVAEDRPFAEVDAARLRKALANRQAEGDTHTLQELKSWQRMAKEIERLRDVADKAYDSGFRVGVEKAPSYKENNELRDEIERLRSALETILTVPTGEGAAASMSKIALQALRVREALREKP